MKVVFMGTPVFAAEALRAVAAEHEVVCVYTQPPRPAGKGYKLTPSPVQVTAEELGIPVRCPTTLRTPEAQANFAALQADIGVVCAYGLILPQAILDAPAKGCLNIHASLLPRWRGAAPIQRAIQAGDAETGITIMQMDAGLDTGPMLLSESTPITATTTAAELHDRLMIIGCRLITQALNHLPQPIPQPAEGATYAAKLQKTEALIDWAQPAEQIERTIRAFNPVPTAYLMNGAERIKVFAAEVAEPTTAPAGTVLDDTLRIACGHGTSLRLTHLQRPGKKSLPADEILKGWTLPKGTNLAV